MFKNIYVSCINCLNFKPIGSCKITDTDFETCKICICDLCDCDKPEDSRSFLERPLYIPKK